jgi:hypothetical protein
MRASSLVWLAALVTGCAAATSSSVYTPSPEAALEDAPGDLAGHAAATYPVPTKTPHGDVRVAVVGFTTIGAFRARPVQALKVRMMVHNDDRELWTMDTTVQKGSINAAPGNATTTARLMLALCDGHRVPLVVVMPGDTRTVDLYYELPPSVPQESAIRSFRVDWRIDTPGGLLASHVTPFDRHDVPRPVRPPPKPVDPMNAEQERATRDDGIPQPGRAEANGWPSWRN